MQNNVPRKLDNTPSAVKALPVNVVRYELRLPGEPAEIEFISPNSPEARESDSLPRNPQVILFLTSENRSTKP